MCFVEICNALRLDLDLMKTRDVTSTEKLVKWEPPPLRWTLLNADGASKGNPGMAPGGGVPCGDKGEWIHGFVKIMGCALLLRQN